MSADALNELRDAWRGAWETALAAWSRFVKLAEPRWCFDEADCKREGISGSFAMIRLVDHAVVINLAQVHTEGLAGFAVEILAHEIGHHVYAPGDLVDNARALARIRHALPTREQYAGLVSNLYTDLLINDRLQRSAGLDIAGVYRILAANDRQKPDKLWAFYMRTYEVLWELPAGTLVAREHVDPQVATDAVLGARLVRVYGKDWLRGAGRFAMLVLPYLLEKVDLRLRKIPWLDAMQAGVGGELPDGLAQIEEDEIGGAIHPCEDPAITGVDLDIEPSDLPDNLAGAAVIGGRKNLYREPQDYVTLMHSAGVNVDPKDVIVRYYRELALPHIVGFPVRLSRDATDPLPEGLEVWDVASPIGEVDWVESMVRSPWVVPGVTTLARTFGQTEGADPQRTPVDLYLGVDCSGSMSNPAHSRSYPVLAGTVLVLSALRTGSRVMVCLSGEPGLHAETDGFGRDERAALGVLTGYLGTGYAFGVRRLEETFLTGQTDLKRPVHLLVVTDSDIFMMLARVENGWEIIREAARVAGGGATFVLDRCPTTHYGAELERLGECGWDVHHVHDQEGLLAFARAFARKHYVDPGRQA